MRYSPSNGKIGKKDEIFIELWPHRTFQFTDDNILMREKLIQVPAQELRIVLVAAADLQVKNTGRSIIQVVVNQK